MPTATLVLVETVGVPPEPTVEIPEVTLKPALAVMLIGALGLLIVAALWRRTRRR